MMIVGCQQNQRQRSSVEPGVSWGVEQIPLINLLTDAEQVTVSFAPLPVRQRPGKITVRFSDPGVDSIRAAFGVGIALRAIRERPVHGQRSPLPRGQSCAAAMPTGERRHP
ncbi:MAG: hypothetical protein NZ699_11970 [Roseiflexus sp.]|nr:hypothetical protein [Roseiflexus sp.]MCS7289838.1 hypothetical protein [Roseiflexus sp.]MDW8146925.1 hypothetical protein [Roseiflexaceae bacterium]MDW8232566.1 hypothetical protein [Roseiflexaceae bacterium]